jgi:hypothetical protein
MREQPLKSLYDTFSVAIWSYCLVKSVGTMSESLERTCIFHHVTSIATKREREI